MRLVEHDGSSTAAPRSGSDRPSLTSAVHAGTLVSRWSTILRTTLCCSAARRSPSPADGPAGQLAARRRADVLVVAGTSSTICAARRSADWDGRRRPQSCVVWRDSDGAPGRCPAAPGAPALCGEGGADASVEFEVDALPRLSHTCQAPAFAAGCRWGAILMCPRGGELRAASSPGRAFIAAAKASAAVPNTGCPLVAAGSGVPRPPRPSSAPAFRVRAL